VSPVLPLTARRRAAAPDRRPAAPGPRRRAAALALAAFAALGAPATASADGLPVKLALRAGRVAASVNLEPVLPVELEGRMGNGLRNVLTVVVAIVPVDGGAPSAGHARLLEILYDVWEETWTVTVRDPQAPSGRRQVLRSPRELHQLLVHAADADLGPVSSLPAGRFTVDVRLDVNPISPELLARTREYLAGSAGPGGGSRSVLGTVAGFLLREPDDGGEPLLFRSQPLTADSVQP
jgi:hypothetical protein